VLCACVVPCVRVLCARALRVHTRGYTHLISANGFGCDARGNCGATGTHQVLSSLPRVVGGYPRIPGLKHRVSNTGAVFTLRTAPSRCRRLLMRCASSSPTISACAAIERRSRQQSARGEGSSVRMVRARLRPRLLSTALATRQPASVARHAQLRLVEPGHARCKLLRAHALDGSTRRARGTAAQHAIVSTRCRGHAVRAHGRATRHASHRRACRLRQAQGRAVACRRAALAAGQAEAADAAAAARQRRDRAAHTRAQCV
jgi:hypothetical protein